MTIINEEKLKEAASRIEEALARAPIEIVMHVNESSGDGAVIYSNERGNHFGFTNEWLNDTDIETIVQLGVYRLGKGEKSNDQE